MIKIITYTRLCYDYQWCDFMTLHDLKLGDFLYTTVSSSLKEYLSMNRVHFRSSKEGSHSEQLQLLKSHLIILNYSKIMLKCFHGLLFPKLCWHIRLNPNCISQIHKKICKINMSYCEFLPHH